jgi:hypothetical protein
MASRIVWSVDWPWLLVLWPVLVLKALVWLVVTAPVVVVRWTIRFYRWSLDWRVKESR